VVIAESETDRGCLRPRSQPGTATISTAPLSPVLLA
jgi:hypothetical protein